MGFLKREKKKLAQSFNLIFRHIDDVFSLNYSKCGDYVDRIYLTELEITDTTDTATCRTSSYLDFQLEFDSEGWVRMNFYNMSK